MPARSISRSTSEPVSPTCSSPLSPSGDNFVVSYSDSSVIIFDTRTGEELLGMASTETYDGTPATSINTIAATSSASLGAEAGGSWADEQDAAVGAGPTGSAQGVEGVIVSGHEDRYIRFFDANSGMSFLVSSLYHTNASRPMHIHDARPPLGHLIALTLTRRPRSRLGRPRRQHPLLVAGQAHLHAGHPLPPADARRRRVLRRMEPGRTVRGQRGRRRRGQGVFEIAQDTKADIMYKKACLSVYESSKARVDLVDYIRARPFPPVAACLREDHGDVGFGQVCGSLEDVHV